MVLPYPKINVILPRFLDFVGDAVLVAHNASFDVGFISHFAEEQGLPFNPTVLDTVTIARLLLPNLNRFKLDTVAKALNISWLTITGQWMMQGQRLRYSPRLSGCSGTGAFPTWRALTE